MIDFKIGNTIFLFNVKNTLELISHEFVFVPAEIVSKILRHISEA